MNEFNKLFNELYKSDFSKLNKYIKLKYICTIIFIISLITGFISIYLSIKNSIETTGLIFTLSVIFFILSFITLLIINNQTDKLIHSDYYYNIILKIINLIFPNSRYSHAKILPEHLYRRCNYLAPYDIYQGENYVSTNINNQSLQFSEIKTIVETINPDDTVTHYTNFQGACAYLNCNLNIDSNIRIIANLPFGDKMRLRNQIVTLDSNEFEKFFDVICDNKINAMQFLTADVMHKLVSIVKECNIPFEIYLEKRTGIYFKFYIHDFLDLNMKKDALDFKTLKKHYDNLKYIKDVVTYVHDSAKSLEF